MKIREMVFSKAFPESSRSSRDNIFGMEGDLVNHKAPVSFPQLRDGNDEDNCGLVWTGWPSNYSLKIEGRERYFNSVDSGTRPKEFLNELRPEGKLGVAIKEKM